MNVSGESVSPVAADWSYKTYGGEFIALDDLKTSNPTEKIYPVEDIELR